MISAVFICAALVAAQPAEALAADRPATWL